MNRAQFLRRMGVGALAGAAFVAAPLALPLAVEPRPAPRSIRRGRLTPQNDEGQHVRVLRDGLEVGNVAWWDFDEGTYGVLRDHHVPGPKDTRVLGFEADLYWITDIWSQEGAALIDTRTGRDFV